MTPYYADDQVTLYHGDCLEIDAWLEADVLVTDPPYGRGWKSGAGLTNSAGYGYSEAHRGIPNDLDTTARDSAISAWGNRPGIVFGDLLVELPRNAVQCLVYAKPTDAEAIYLIGPWDSGIGGRSSIITTRGRVAGPRGIGPRSGHPHCKAIGVEIEERYCELIAKRLASELLRLSGAGVMAAVQAQEEQP